MPYDQTQFNLAKKCLLGALVVFVVEFLAPQVTAAAHENYVERAKEIAAQRASLYFDNGSAYFSEEAIFTRSEKLFAYADRAIVSLPLETEYTVNREYWLTVSAYSSTIDQTDDSPFITAWQTPVREGVVAINFLPKGTMVRFPDYFGDKIFIVEDRMNARYQYRADIWMPTREYAVAFGLKYLRMEVLDVQVDRDYVLKNFTPYLADAEQR